MTNGWGLFLFVFESLIANGANFASSPKRIHIHTYDPAVIAIKCATTSYLQNVDFNQILKYIENGKDAVGGIETKGKMKLLLWGKKMKFKAFAKINLRLNVLGKNEIVLEADTVLIDDSGEKTIKLKPKEDKDDLSC